MDRRTRKLFNKAYKTLRCITPLNMDCGTICDKACCQGGDEKGMLLFPGEEEYLVDNKFLEIRSTSIVLDSGRRIYFALCKGMCDRAYRPLSCMIFPLIPVIKDSRIFLEIDLRGRNTCPIVDNLKSDGLYEPFIEKVYRAISLLQKLDDGIEFIEILSDIQKDTKSLMQKVSDLQP